MSQVSKYQLNNRIYTKIFTLFPQFLYRMTSRGKQAQLVDAFFTRTEKIVIAKRVAIAFMLVKGYTYDQIVGKIKVSHGTVAKIADSIRTHDQIIVKELMSISKEDSFIEFLGAISYGMAKLLPPKNGNWSRWRGKIEKEKRDSEAPI